MKKLLLLLLVSLMSITTNAQSNVEFQGNTIVTKSTRAKGEAKKTTFTWQDRKGKEYPVYMSATGSCFVVRTSSNTGKEYRSYLGPEVSQQICTKLGIEYKGKKKEKNKS